MNIRPTPTEEEMAAIAVAVQALVLRPVVVAGGADAGPPSPVWRFSGRWWSRPVPVRRFRPWT
ncbi:MAG TPA: hypothetical protein VM262_12045 [Acidimicrobiales bacterium]|nr:hypothetical protein [Acidimicrobiales bacterium]